MKQKLLHFIECQTYALAKTKRWRELAKHADYFSVVFHRAYENHNYNHHSNGELWLLSKLASANLLDVVFDVGANRGDWTECVLKANPASQVHCFEICPPTFEKLRLRLGGRTNILLNNFGLSNIPGETEIHYSSEHDGLTSTFSLDTIPDAQALSVRIDRGDKYCQRSAVKAIGMLKIDVEGAEPNVLAGFGDLIHPDAIPIVQFEYGRVNIESKYLLRDFYHYFHERGYLVGKLFPDGLRIREYSSWDEDFLGPNYVAVRSDLSAFLRSPTR